MLDNTDSKFFTNSANNTVLDRFKATLNHAQYFDVLVGYFRTSGFSLLADSLKNVEKIRILVGLNADKAIVDAASSQEFKNDYALSVQQEIEDAPETEETENSIHLFTQYIQQKKIEIRGFPSQDIHAKVYIIRYDDLIKNIFYGSVISGSSNFTYPGLKTQKEFNVELKDTPEVKFALAYFENLWAQGIPLTQDFVSTTNKKTWINPDIQPYQLYLKFLYEYFKEDITLDNDEDFSSMMPEGFSTFEYQKQAVIAAKKILEMHNGVFLADVVGLGKTFITAMLLQQLLGRKIIICPPVLKDYWQETLRSFYVHPFKVFSSGKLEDILAEKDYQYVVIDESHKFRNENTQGYAHMKDICLGKKVILLSATPLNNKLSDILAQLKLFQAGNQSTIPNVPNLELFFRNKEKVLARLNPKTSEYKKTADEITDQIRDKVLKYVMIRRTRSEIEKYFPNDMKRLSFPVVETPISLEYQFDSLLDTNFQNTLELLQDITYARYTPLLYLKKGPNAQQKNSQNNLRALIKCLLVKRLESSFYAFAKTVERFLASHNNVLNDFNKGFVYVGGNFDYDKFLEHEEAGDLDDFLNQKAINKIPAENFKPSFPIDVQHDYELLMQMALLWKNSDKDPKYDTFIHTLETDKHLKNERVLVFTESKETAEYLYGRIEKEHPSLSMMFSSQEGRYKNQFYSLKQARLAIKKNFDPTHEEQLDDFRILITTDVLSEGMNLHRAGRIMNYDLPWNPTRVMQRVGRINRVGTSHDKLYIYNFFPTAQADTETNFEKRVIKKIDAFNAILGNDGKFLYNEETPDPHGLLGKLSDISENIEEDSELKYLSFIRDIHDNQPELFEKIKSLPIKARSAHDTAPIKDSLLVFFRQGEGKKFLLVGKDKARELTFLDAVALMQCPPEATQKHLPPDYFQRLQRAKAWLAEQEMKLATTKQLSPKKTAILNLIRALQKHSPDTKQNYLQLLHNAVQESGIAQKDISHLHDLYKAALAKGTKIDLSALLEQFMSSVPIDTLLAFQQSLALKRTKTRQTKQIVLAQYLA